MNSSQIIEILKFNANEDNVQGMKRYGINTTGTLGISMPFIRILAKKINKNHELALELWDSGFHEARILAALIDIPKKVTTEQMDTWVKEFDSWDVCDQVCMNLFDKTPFAYDKAKEWADRNEEFVKRAGFALMASLAIHDKKADEKKLIDFLPIILDNSIDERNFVKKAVNWALRQIGKRSQELNQKAIYTAESIISLHKDNISATWIARDALKELTSLRVKQKLGITK